MRRCSTAFVGVVSAIAFTQIAAAADLPRKAPAYTPPPPPAISWTGWYVGLNAGYVDMNGDVNTNAAILSFPSDPTTSTTLAAAATNGLSGRSGGFLGGGQFGYNYQFTSAFVAGIEADIQGSSLRGNLNTANAVPTNTTSGPNTANWLTTTTVSRDLNYLGTLRGRIGVTATPTFLFYGTGGLAYGGVSSSTSMTVAANFPNGVPVGGVAPGLAAGSFSGTRVGWAAGAGVEWMFVPNWSAKLEYLHYDLGSETYATGGYSVSTGPTSLPGSGLASIATSTTVHFKGDIVRVGVNYKFY